MTQLRTIREVDSPFNDTSMEMALDVVYQELLGMQPRDAEEALYYMNIAMWRFALQFAENLDAVRPDVMSLWSSREFFPAQCKARAPSTE